MKLDKLPINSNTMCVQVVSSNTDHIIYCLDENSDVIQVTSISEATVDEVISMIPHMVILALDPHNVFNMICGFKLRAGQAACGKRPRALRVRRCAREQCRNHVR